MQQYKTLADRNVYIYISLYTYMGFSGGSWVKNLPANAVDGGWVSWVRRKWQPTPIVLPGKSYGIAESDMTE